MAAPGQPAYDPLFLALSQAESLPSHAFRDTMQALQIPGQALGGYEEGLNARQQIDQLKMLSTPLGSIFGDPQNIPYGLKPSNTVRDLMTIGPSLQNYIPANVNRNVSSGGGAPQTTPSPNIGTQDLEAAGGAGQGQGGDFAPGSPIGTPPVASVSVPPGGMSRAAYEIAQKQAQMQQEANLAGYREANENARFGRSQGAEESRFERGHATEATAKAAPALNSAAQLEAALAGIQQVNSDPANKSIPFTGNIGAKFAQVVPSTTNKWALNQKAAENIADVGAGAIEKLVEGRYNDQQMARIKNSLFPTGNELGTPVAQQKIAQLQQYVQQAKAGAKNQLFASLDAVAGQPVNAEALATPVGSVLPQNQDITAAQTWLRKNRNHPKAAAVRAKLLAMQNGQ